MWILCVSYFVLCLLRSTCGQIDIRNPPSITKGPSKQNFIYRSDDSITLDCKGQGVPAVRYDWKKNGFELNPNLPNIDKGADGTITIRQAATSDEGFYQCFVKNQYGTALSITAHLQRALLDSGSGTPSALTKTVVAGMPFHIQADPRRSFPKPTFGWEIATDVVDKSPVPLRSSRRIQIAENGDLHFAYALPEDSLNGKIYKFSTYNPYLDVKAGGSYTQLTVIGNSTITPFHPTLGFASEAQTVALIGGIATLRCFFYGYPEPTIAWTGPRNTWPCPIGRYTLNPPFNTELTINNITKSDEGDYVCTASNTGGLRKHTLQIRVEVVPIFRNVNDGPYDVNVTEGESLTFNCSVDAKPEAKIVWLQDGVELDACELPRRFSISNDMKRLTITDLCRNCEDRDTQTDLTVIQCNASNIHGYAFASGYLNVLSKTKVFLLNDQDVHVEMYEEKEVNFECSATSDLSTPLSVRWYRVENNETQPVQENPPTVTIKDGSLTIYVNPNGTKKWGNYHGEYRCVGDNGYSKATAVVKLIVEEYVPPVEPPPKDYSWIWICIGVVVFLIVLIGICYAVYGRQRNKKAGQCNIAKAPRNAVVSGIESAYPLYETIDDGLEAIRGKLGVGSGYRQNNNAKTSMDQIDAPRASATASSRITTVDSSTQTEITGTECRCCGQSRVATSKQQSGSEYMALEHRDLAALSTYAELKLA